LKNILLEMLVILRDSGNSDSTLLFAFLPILNSLQIKERPTSVDISSISAQMTCLFVMMQLNPPNRFPSLRLLFSLQRNVAAYPHVEVLYYGAVLSMKKSGE